GPAPRPGGGRGRVSHEAGGPRGAGGAGADAAASEAAARRAGRTAAVVASVLRPALPRPGAGARRDRVGGGGCTPAVHLREPAGQYGAGLSRRALARGPYTVGQRHSPRRP